ncbi:hypothetical protein WJX72_011058 [[Myrmecia] bisecta]|uniref:Sugar phosphate transporter domain-containing protein n=1 Tax=[Myrmecia] bisecta TaxID=41462 RepID=A0AAW1R942_9CHLO
MNRWVLGVYGFKYPILLTLCHLAFGFCVLAPIMALKSYRTLHRPTWERQWRGFVAVGTFKVANIVLNNISLVFISLSLSQIIRSAIPVVTALLGVLIERKVPTRFELGSLIILTAGVVLSVWEGSISGSVYGIVISLSSVVCGAAMLSFSGAVLSEKLDVLRMTFYTAPVSCTVLLPFFFLQEAGSVGEYWRNNSKVVVLYILAGGVNAVLYNIIHYLMIQITSAVTTPVIGMVKVIGLVVLSAVVLAEKDIFTLKMTAGCALALLGFGLYSWARLQKQRPSARDEETTALLQLPDKQAKDVSV